MEAELEYWKRRAEEERRAAMRASGERVRRCHLEMAAAYDLRIKKLKPARPRPTLHIIAAG